MALSPPDIGADRPSLRPDLADVVTAVHKDFDERVGPRQVDEVLDEVASRFDQAPVRAFVPLLVQRYTRETLLSREPAVDLREEPATAVVA
ncbi:hypothetical protein GCM10027446_30310 [Angustibacter peucedani]